MTSISYVWHFLKSTKDLLNVFDIKKVLRLSGENKTITPYFDFGNDNVSVYVKLHHRDALGDCIIHICK